MSTLLTNASKISALSLTFCGLLVSGQANAAWGNDSPWSKKHEELKKQAALEEVIIDAPVIDTAVIEPVVSFEAEPVDMVLEPVLTQTEVFVEEGDILSLPSSHYAVQVYASSSTDNMDKYQANNGLEDLRAVKTARDGSDIYVLISLHEDRSSANEAASNLEEIIGSKPWVRSVGSLQAVVVQ